MSKEQNEIQWKVSVRGDGNRVRVGRKEELPKEARWGGGHFFCSLGTFPISVEGFIFFGGCPWGPQIVLVDDRECLVGKNGQGDAPLTPPTPVDLDLDWVLGKMPQKVCEPGRGVRCAVAFLSY